MLNLRSTERTINGQHDRLKRVWPALLTALAIALPALLLVPVQIYGSNPYEFKAALADLAAGILVLAGIATVTLTALLVLLPRRWFQGAAALLLALAILIWVHGQLLVHDYGVLDGGEIDWLGQGLRLSIDVLLWLMIPTAAFVLRARLVPLAPWLAAALLVMHTIPAWRAWQEAPRVPDFHRYSLDDSLQFSFSPERNVVVIVLDAFQSDVFQRIIMEDERWLERLEGFTYFRNALAGFAKTYPSLALMFSGHWYDNDRPLQEHVQQSFRDNSIPYLLRRQGWRVDLHPSVKRVVDVSPQVASNAVPAVSCAVRLSETGRLADLGLFRVSPHWLKPFWLNAYAWRLAGVLPAICHDGTGGSETAIGRGEKHAALRFLSRAKHEFRTDLESPSFKLYHLLIPHAPFRLDENLELADLPAGRDGFQRQSRAALEVVARLLSQLDEQGIYDETLVAIVSDHGGGEYVDSIDLESLPSAFDRTQAGTGDVPIQTIASGLPLILIKPPAARGSLQTSDVPVSLADLGATIAALLDLETRPPGENMYTLNESEERDRFYRHYRFTGFSDEYLPTMTEYQVRGFSWLAESWEPTGRDLSPAGGQGRAPRSPYPMGEVIRFHRGSPWLKYLESGWSVPDENGMVWSRSRRAVIDVPLPDDIGSSLLLRLDFLPHTGRGRIEDPVVEVTVNERLEQIWQGEKRGWRELKLPPGFQTEEETLRLEFKFPDAASPADLGIGEDVRTLGIALYGMQLVDESEAGTDER